MAQIIKPKRKHTSGAPTTSDLEANEIAINTTDFSIYVRDDANNILKVGGVQTPMNQDLDTNHFTITDSYSSDIAPATVNFGSPLCLPKYTTAEANALVKYDPSLAIVGDTYKIKDVGDVTNAQWAAMGAVAGSGSTPYQNVVFTCTAVGPTGTTGKIGIGLDSTGSDKFNGMIIFNTDTIGVQVYRAYAYAWGNI
jgi:hypothetical protein